MRHHHHRHHHSGIYATTPTPNRTPRTGDWMHNPPPWRMPRTHADGLAGIFILLLLGELFAIIWAYEAMAWLSVWCGYGLLLGSRKIYRSNAIGQTFSGRQKRVRPVYDPHRAPRQPVDLAAMPQPYTVGQPPSADPWDTGGMRRRS